MYADIRDFEQFFRHLLILTLVFILYRKGCLLPFVNDAQLIC